MLEQCQTATLVVPFPSKHSAQRQVGDGEVDAILDGRNRVQVGGIWTSHHARPR